MMRNILIIVVGVMMTFSSLFTPFVAEATTQNTASNLKQYRMIVKKNLNNINSNFTVTYTGNQNTLRKNLANIVPTEIKKDPLVKATVKTYKYSGSSNTKKMVIKYKMTYYTTKAQENYAKKETKKIANTIKKKNKGQFNRVKAVNDYIVGKVTYGGRTDAKYTTYGVLKNNIAVCQGYSITGYRLLKEMNIPVRYVTGRSNNENHSWLKVSVDKKWYNLDITWNDPKPNNNHNRSYNYFLLNDKELRKSHSWNNSGLPKANSAKYNFLKYTSSVTQKGNTLYYSNNKNKQRLYSFNVKTAKHKKISNIRVQYLVYKNGKLYFSNYSDRGKLASMKTNGKEKRNLNSTHTKNIQVKGSKIVYQTKGKYYHRNA